ncbi:MAG TPA: PQQ-like beta-propeller repeat protein [Opitutaceae bacterium]|jgi:outer membrane protein assembly factor BamB|nr:PQQ-like beta-propeller repeat protein [Opitutaceae bacterium]HRE06414.1 PQQ-like beta-propeller repeat protein [Opitutaceae bacterium]
MTLKTPSLLAVSLALWGGSPSVHAADWSHIMGSGFDRKTSEGPKGAWTKGQPRQVWQIPAEGGFSSFVTGGGMAFTVLPTSAGGTTRETAVGLDRTSGRILWRTPLGVSDYARGGDRGAPGNDGGDGPRATPVYSEGRVFVFGGAFDLHALDATTGRVVWKRDLIKEFGGQEIHWGNSASPLVVGDRVIVAGGGKNQTFLAFKAASGEVIWKAGSDRATYSTPILATLHGKAQALFMVERGLVSLDPATGAELWHYPFPYRTATAASPVVWNDIVNCTAGYGVGGGACQVTFTGGKWTVAELWRSPGNKDTAAHWSTAVAHDGYLYGCYGHGDYGRGAFKCIDIRTGKVQWQKAGFGHGQVILAGNRLLATTDAGVLKLIEPTPAAYREIASADIIEGKVWASPALSNGQVLLRSTTHGVCVEL